MNQEISKRIENLIDAFVDHAEDRIHTRELRKVVGELRLLPLVFNWDPFCISPEGDIVALSQENHADREVVTDRRIINIVLFQGIKKYPELEELMPIRSADDVACQYCGGTGVEPTAKELNLTDTIICYCGGLGWIPKESD